MDVVASRQVRDGQHPEATSRRCAVTVSHANLRAARRWTVSITYNVPVPNRRRGIGVYPPPRGRLVRCCGEPRRTGRRVTISGRQATKCGADTPPRARNRVLASPDAVLLQSVALRAVDQAAATAASSWDLSTVVRPL